MYFLIPSSSLGSETCLLCATSGGVVLAESEQVPAYAFPYSVLPHVDPLPRWNSLAISSSLSLKATEGAWCIVGGEGGMGRAERRRRRSEALFLTCSFLLLFPISCVGRGQMYFHAYDTQMADAISMLNVLEAETANSNGEVFCTHAENGSCS